MTNYQKAKVSLKQRVTIARMVFHKERMKDIIHSIELHISKEFNLNEREGNLLSNYCCRLHPK